jgi:zinc metalloprotease ZmpB
MIKLSGYPRAAFLLLPALHCATALALGSGADVDQPKPAFNAVATLETADGRFAGDGRAIVLYRPDFRSNRRGSAESMAREFTLVRAAQLGIANSPAVLTTSYQRDDDVFSVVRFAQTLDGVPVYGSDIAVSVKPDGEVVFVSSEMRPRIDAISIVPEREVDNVRSEVVSALGMHAARDEISPRLMVYADIVPSRLVWVYLLREPSRAGVWEVIADASTGKILDSHDTNLYVNGTATVFDPDPLTTALATYGATGFTDSSDADSAALTGQLQSVTLNDITQASGVFRLEGPWARCDDWDSPFGGVNDCPTPATSDFSTTRSDQKFEGPHVYHLLDKQMRYLNQTLGVTVVPNSVAGGVRFDPHGFNGDDNSSFTPSTDRLTFGEGGVDDAEDADVVLHELGHGLHDWVTNGGLSQTQGLSEGVGDYFASSYNRSTGHWTPSDPQWFWMFHWDGHGTDTWAGRVTNWNLTHTYPGNLGSGIHAQGQYWASCNLIAWVTIGRDAMDKAMLRGLAMTSGSTNQKDAAQAVITAASTMGYSPAQIQALGSAYNTSCTYGVTVPSTDVIFAHGFEN